MDNYKDNCTQIYAVPIAISLVCRMKLNSINGKLNSSIYLSKKLTT